MITTIEKLIPKHDYSKDNCYLIFYHNVKPQKTIEIKAEWFDLNYGDKVLWLLVKQAKSENGRTKYKNLKFKNIDHIVKVESK